MTFLGFYIIIAVLFGGFVWSRANTMNEIDLDKVALENQMPRWIVDPTVLGLICGITWPITLPLYWVAK